MNYQSMLALAQEHGFDRFTSLQEQAFRNEDAFNYEKDLFIMGETSSGKTLIPLLLYGAALKEAEEQGKAYPKMLFVVPYRALAAQKTREMQEFFKDFDLKIAQSTGEFRQDDDAVQKAQLHIAVVITEKIYKYEARDPEFLSQYDFLVLDEIGLINNADRGIRLDFVLAWAENQKMQNGRPRIVVLGTPFYDWSAYIKSYGFTAIRAEHRPVELEEISVVYAAQGIDHVDGNCSFLYRTRYMTHKEWKNLEESYGVPASRCPHLGEELCPMTTPCRSDRSLVCPTTKEPCSNMIHFLPADCKRSTYDSILLKICREHLSAGQQILIFVNDRARVMQYCSLLYRELKDLLPAAPPASECKEAILAECNLESDDVFGILEQGLSDASESEFYQAFKSGVAFHSRALPNELRTYVEKKLLDSRELQIVCSTETLAFGVNSAVDVVIIADIYKHEGSVVAPLSLNEYQNYAGRAGRLRPDVDSKDIKGYVYTLIKKSQVNAWSEMKDSGDTPETLYSLFHVDQGQFMPFFLLNLLPSSSANSMSVADLVKAVRFLPQDGSVSDEEMEQKIKDGLLFLKENHLAVLVQNTFADDDDDDDMDATPRYCLTTIGTNLRGYIIGRNDYQILTQAIEGYVDSLFLEPDKAEFIFNLLRTKHAENGLNSVFDRSETLLDIEEVRACIKKHIEDDYGSDEWLTTCKNTKLLFILAALLSWCDGDSPKTLYNQFGLHYALLSKLAEQIAYLIEIAQAILPLQMENIYKEKRERYSQLGISYEDYMEAVSEKLKQIQQLFISLYYGLNTKRIQKVHDFVAEKTDAAPDDAILNELSLQFINPITARNLRRLVVRYKFFENPPEIDVTNVEARNNLRDQTQRYKKDVYEFGPYIAAFFRQTFPEAFSD